MLPISSLTYASSSSSSSSSSSTATSQSYASAIPHIGSKRKLEESETKELESKITGAKKQKTDPSSTPQELPETGGLCKDAWTEILQFLPGSEVYATWTRVDKYFNAFAPSVVVHLALPRYSFEPLTTIIPRLHGNLRSIDIVPLWPHTVPKHCLSLLKRFSLERLTLGSAFLFGDGASFEEIVHRHCLKTLKIWDSERLQEKALESLKSFPLTSLSLSCLKKPPNADSLLTHFPPTLEQLSLYNSNITSLANLTAPKLKELHLIRCRSLSDQESKEEDSLVGSGIEPLKKFTLLEKLDLTECPVTKGINWLSDLRFLTTISLAETGITDKDLKIISTIASLHRLSVYKCPNITNEGMRHLSTLMLTILEIGYNLAIDDEGITHLENQKNLTKLSVRQTSITNASLVVISNFSSLRYLDLLDCEIDCVGLWQLFGLLLKTLILSRELILSLRRCYPFLVPNAKALYKILKDSRGIGFDFINE